MSKLTDAIHSYECEACVDFDQVDYARAEPFIRLKKLLPAHDAATREQAERKQMEADIEAVAGYRSGNTYASERIRAAYAKAHPEAGPKDQAARCRGCGEPMPPGEEVFKYHGYSGPCPKVNREPAHD